MGRRALDGPPLAPHAHCCALPAAAATAPSASPPPPSLAVTLIPLAPCRRSALALPRLPLPPLWRCPLLLPPWTPPYRMPLYHLTCDVPFSPGEAERGPEGATKAGSLSAGWGAWVGWGSELVQGAAAGRRTAVWHCGRCSPCVQLQKETGAGRKSGIWGCLSPACHAARCGARQAAKIDSRAHSAFPAIPPLLPPLAALAAPFKATSRRWQTQGSLHYALPRPARPGRWSGARWLRGCGLERNSRQLGRPAASRRRESLGALAPPVLGRPAWGT